MNKSLVASKISNKVNPNDKASLKKSMDHPSSPACARHQIYTSAFTKNAELRLKTFINLCYILYVIPVRLHYDNKQKKYILHTSKFRTVACIVRVSINIIIFICFLLLRLTETIPPGPVGVLLGGLYISSFVTSICYFLTMLSCSSQQGILELINLIKLDEPKEKKLSIYKDIRAIGSVMIPFLFCAGGPLVAHLYNHFKHGLEKTMLATWYGVSTPDNDLNDFYWWKKVISFYIVLAQMDQHIITGNAIAFFIITAKTLEVACIQFTNSVRDTQKVDIVPRKEVIQEFLRIRKAFSVVSRSLGPLLLMVVITGNLGTCTNFVWVFKDTTISTLSKFSALNFIVGFMYLLLLSAHASNRLSMVLRFLSFPDPNCSSRNSNFLLRNIVIHEISSGSVGLKPCGIFVITYDFIAGMMITVMSNAAIVLQNFEAIVAKWAINNAEIDNEQCSK